MGENEKLVPYVVYESTMSRMERTIKRLWVLCMILIAVIIGSNIAWIYYESQFETVSVEQEVTAEDNVNVTGTGDIINGGKSEAESNNP